MKKQLPTVRFKEDYEPRENEVLISRLHLYYSSYLNSERSAGEFSEVKGGNLDGFGLLLNPKRKWYLVQDNLGRTILLGEDVNFSGGI